MKRSKRIRLITQGAIIASLYVVLTVLSDVFGLASLAIQCRLSEALCVLPAFSFSAVPGLFVGCFISNLFVGGGANVFDVVFGSLATLIGALGTYFLSKHTSFKYIYPLPTILANTVIVPLVLKYALKISGPIWYFALTVGLGEIVSAGVLGVVLYFSLEKNAKRIFK